jgi:hypothetical protein
MKTLSIFTMLYILSLAPAVRAATANVGNCSVDIVSAHGPSIHSRFQLVRSVAGDSQYPALLRVELLKTNQGESLVLTVEEESSGFFATIATPESNVYPPKPPTFSLNAMAIDRRVDGAPLLLLTNYRNANDSEITSIDLICSLLK